MTRTVLFDCDDVLLNWLESFRLFVIQKEGRYICNRGPSNWDMSEWLGVTPYQARAYIEEHNASEWFERLEPFEGAKEFVAAVDETSMCNVITSCSRDFGIQSRRRTNLVNVFGDVFYDVVCLDLGESKHDALSNFEGDVVWFEDNYKNAMLGVELGFRTYMKRTSHNVRFEEASDKRITWFSEWAELNPERI